MVTVLLAIVVALVSLSGAWTAYNLTRLQKRVFELEARVRQLELEHGLMDQLLTALQRERARYSN